MAGSRRRARRSPGAVEWVTALGYLMGIGAAMAVYVGTIVAAGLIASLVKLIT